MKYKLVIVLLVIFFIFSGCDSKENIDIIEKKAPKQILNQEEIKRVNLYVSVLIASFDEGHGGSGFIAVETNNLKYLPPEGKAIVLERLEGLVAEVYAFEDIQDDSDKFKKNKSGDVVRIMNGTILRVDVEEFNNKEAIAQGSTQFGNMQGIFPKYEATYEGGQWRLRLLSVTIKKE